MPQPPPVGPREPNKQQFNRDEQLAVVALSHFCILVGVVIIVSAFDLHATVPLVFLIGELWIIASSVLLVAQMPALKTIVRFFQPAWGPIVNLLKALRGRIKTPVRPRRPDRVDRVKGVALLVCFVVQFVALAALLHSTGGPVASPFAQMVLAYAIFTPFIATKDKTIGGVLACSIVYYAGLVYYMGHLETDYTGRWAFFFINGMVTAVGVLIAYLDKNHRQRAQLADSIGAGSSSAPSPDDSGRSSD